MALKIYERYEPLANPGTAEYPTGSIKNKSAPQNKDGTPIEQDWANDLLGMRDAILAAGNVQADGNVENAVNSQIVEALKAFLVESERVVQSPGSSEDDVMSQKAVTEYVNDQGGMPLGMPIWWNGERGSIPAGYLPLDGQKVSRSAYPQLAAMVDADAYPTVSEANWSSNKGKFVKNTGDGNMRLPDLNGTYGGLFVRGDGGSGSGEVRRDQIQNITGVFGARRTTYDESILYGDSGAFYRQGRSSSNPSLGLNASGSSLQLENMHFDASRVARTGSETYPSHVTGVWCIRAYGAQANTGDIDVQELIDAYNSFMNAPNFSNMPLVGGSPIVESGENANGRWTKWADGTMVCLIDILESRADSGVWETPVSFPQQFLRSPHVVSTLNTTVPDRASNISYTDSSTTGITLCIERSNSTNTRADIIAIGRWK